MAATHDRNHTGGHVNKKFYSNSPEPHASSFVWLQNQRHDLIGWAGPSISSGWDASRHLGAAGRAGNLQHAYQKPAVRSSANPPDTNLIDLFMPKPVIRKLPSISIDSPTASTSGTNLILAPPSNESTPTIDTPSSTDAASLAVKAKLINQSITTIVIKSNPNTIKKRQPSTKPMRVSSKITAWNLCALEWQSNGHQKEPASVFATYWNSLSSTDKEVYKRKAASRLMDMR
ncbi:hypothetical protein EV702DRAFT_1040695 [Suillus placidus]|uniref:Uncharacterized protein n=1 Tax=Suillus placidus TaxID=48579 RepID=A0A9P7A5S2_9AGAM|nr:hypothetical protein EV702DRAFT_1040695 [Suillus placidus]